MTNGLEKKGGVAALVAAATYVLGFVLLFTLLAPAGYDAGDGDPVRNVAFLADNQGIVFIWNLIIYLVNAVALVVLALSLYERLKPGARAMAQSATAFGLIWAGLVIASGMLILNDLGVVVELYGKDPAQAASVWLVLDSVENGLGGGVEFPGGVWVLLVSCAALKARALPRVVNYLGLLTGAAGILTLVPNVDVFEDVFGLGLLVWFVLAGIVMLRGSRSKAV